MAKMAIIDELIDWKTQNGPIIYTQNSSVCAHVNLATCPRIIFLGLEVIFNIISLSTNAPEYMHCTFP